MFLIGKRGCLRRLLIFIIFAALFGFLFASALKDNLHFGVSLDNYNKFITELKKPINLETYAPNRVSETDKQTMLEKLTDCNIQNLYIAEQDMFVLNKNLQLSKTLTLTNKEFAQFINLGIKENYGSTFEIISLTITKDSTEPKSFNYEIISKLSLASLKEKNSQLKDFPNEIYAKSTTKVQILADKLTSLSTEMIINEIPKDTSKEMFKMLDQMFKVAKLNITCENFLNDTYFNYINTCKTCIKATNVNSLNNNEFSFII